MGTTIIPLNQGVAAFTDLSIDRLGIGYAIVAELLHRPSVSGGAGIATGRDSVSPIWVDISYPSGLLVLPDSIPDKILPTEDVPYLADRLQISHIMRWLLQT